MFYPFTDTVTFIFSKRSINGALVIRQHGIDIEWHQIDRNLSKFKTIITNFPQILSIFPDNVTTNLQVCKPVLQSSGLYYPLFMVLKMYFNYEIFIDSAGFKVWHFWWNVAGLFRNSSTCLPPERKPTDLVRMLILAVPFWLWVESKPRLWDSLDES